ncbi:MAG: peptidylprolyl isomerase [Pseudomonadota bacterium]|nr:peptidylprolyl isomerase [Pseudomonadota bacterium]
MEFPLNLIAQRRLLSATLLAGALALSTAHANTTLDRVVAVVDSTAILESDVNKAMQERRAQLSARQQPIPPEEALRQIVLQQEILRQIQLGLVKRGGLTIDDNALNAAITELAQQQGAPSLMAFQQALDQRQAGSYARLRQQMREDLSINRLRQQQVGSRVRISDRAIDNFLASPQSQIYLSDELRTAHFRVTLPEQATETDLQRATEIAIQVQQALQTDKTIQQVLDTQANQDAYPVGGGDMGFRKPAELPTMFAEPIEQLEVGQVTAPIRAADGIHVIKLLDRRGAERTIIPQWQVRHILISPNEVVSLADAKSRIDSLYERLQQGEDFDTLAKTFSNDTGSARDGGSLGWVTTGEMVPSFDTMMQKTEINDFSTPFQSQFGWHILQVQGKRQHDITEQYRRNVARQALYQREFEQELDNWLREVRASAFVELKDQAQPSS